MRYAIALLLVVIGSSPLCAQRPQPGTDLFQKFYFKTDQDNLGQMVIGISAKSDAPLTDDDLKHLAQFTEVQSIKLNGHTITGAGLKHLAGLGKLNTLSLAFTTIDSEGFQQLSRLTRLRRLNLLNTGYRAEDLKILTALNDLEVLWLGQNFHCQDDDYKVLGQFKKLRALSVGNSNFGDAALGVVATLPDLQTLVFPGCHVTDDGLEPLSKAGRLERFQGNFNMGEKGIEHLGQIKTLREIDLYGCNASVESILAMPNIKKFTKLKPDFRGDDAQASTDKLKASLPGCKFDFFSWQYDEL